MSSSCLMTAIHFWEPERAPCIFPKKRYLTKASLMFLKSNDHPWWHQNSEKIVAGEVNQTCNEEPKAQTSYLQPNYFTIPKWKHSCCVVSQPTLRDLWKRSKNRKERGCEGWHFQKQVKYIKILQMDGIMLTHGQTFASNLSGAFTEEQSCVPYKTGTENILVFQYWRKVFWWENTSLLPRSDKAKQLWKKV